MPRTLAVRSFLVLFFTFTLGAMVSAFDFSEEPAAARMPASTEIEHSQLLQVAVRAPHGIARHEDQETELLGYIRVDRPVSGDLRYRWDLPYGVNIVNGGRSQGYIRELRAGQVTEIRLTVTGFSQDDLKFISLHGYIVDGDRVQGRSASLTSRPRDSYEILNPKKFKAE
jgi:hypothetical protein